MSVGVIPRPNCNVGGCYPPPQLRQRWEISLDWSKPGILEYYQTTVGVGALWEYGGWRQENPDILLGL